jgi:hypothetical protein
MFGVAVLLSAAFALPANADTTLVNYNFDYDVLDSGPDTYQVFRHKNAKVEISTAYAGGGYASAHFTDQVHDGGFVELQGYFPEQKAGRVRFRFKFLIASQSNLFNIALAGKDRYTLKPMGINFWLICQDGWLKHTSDRIPKKLFQPNLYEWYALDALLNLSNGTYSLRITRENGAPAIQLDNQPFAAGTGGERSLKEYSFIGDLDDAQPADYFIDDISISTSNDIKLPEMVAPGRRKYFFEIWNDYHRELQSKLRCLPAKSLEDFGIYTKEYTALARNNQLEILHRLTRTTPLVGNAEEWQSSVELSAIVDWVNACDALEKGKTAQARTYIGQALEKKPTAYIFRLAGVIIDAAKTSDGSPLYNRAYDLPQQGNDVRNQIALAMIAFHDEAYAEAGHERSIKAALVGLDRLGDQDLRRLHELGIRAVSRDYIVQLKRYMPESWEQYLQWMLVLEQQYYSYLWQSNYREAYSLAAQVSKKLAMRSLDPGIWQERQADGAYLNNDLETALDLYNRQAPASISSVLKMADMYHMQGDLASEKSIRESIYRNFSRN